MAQYTINDILNLSDQEIDGLEKNNPKLLYSYAKQAQTYARLRQTRALGAVERRENIPMPQVYSDKWGDFDFSRTIDTPRKASHILKDSIRFLETTTSTFGGYRTSMKEMTKRFLLDERSEEYNRRVKSILNTENTSQMFWRITQMVFETKEIKSTDYFYRGKENESKVLWRTQKLQDLVIQRLIERNDYQNQRITTKRDDDLYARSVANEVIAMINREYEIETTKQIERDSKNGFKLSKRF